MNDHKTGSLSYLLDFWWVTITDLVQKVEQSLAVFEYMYS